MNYAILCDKKPSYMKKFRSKYPDCFVMGFFTKSVAETPDCSRLNDVGIMMPIYVGNLKPVQKAIHQIVARILAPFGECECVLDESGEA